MEIRSTDEQTMHLYTWYCRLAGETTAATTLTHSSKDGFMDSPNGEFCRCFFYCAFDLLGD